MPYVNIKLLGGSDAPTPKQKNEVIKGITQVLVDVLGKNPDTTTVVIDEIDPDNWGLGGQSISERSKKK